MGARHLLETFPLQHPSSLAGREMRHPSAQWVPLPFPQALTAHFGLYPQPPRQGRTFRAAGDATGFPGPGSCLGQGPGARQPRQAAVGAPDEVGTEPGLPRLGPLPPTPRDPRARSALTLNHGNGAAPAGRGLGRT